MSGDWNAIRNLYLAGHGWAEIEKITGVNRGTIFHHARAHGWQTLKGETLPAPKDPISPMEPWDGKDKRAGALYALSQGGTYKIAAAYVGIDPDTLKNWRDKDPEFNAQCQKALADHSLLHLGTITNASRGGDVAAARWALERHPASRSEFRPAESGGGGGVTIVLNIPRSPDELIDVRPVIEGELG